MKLHRVLTINAIIFLAVGIGFTLYAPNVLAYFGFSDLPGDNAILYWNIVAFARMFGAMLFTLGMLLWAARSFFKESADIAIIRREIIFSLVFGFIVATITAIVQQAAVWGSAAGWVLAGLFAVFLGLYSYFLISKKQ